MVVFDYSQLILSHNKKKGSGKGFSFAEALQSAKAAIGSYTSGRG